MKKLVAAFMFLLALPLSLAQAPTYTTNYGFQIPAYGTSNWQVPLDYNFNRLDAILSGSIGAGTGITTWLSTSSYQAGNLILYAGQGYVSLTNGNTGNTPFAGSTYWTNNLSQAAGGTTSGSLTANTVPMASGPSSLINSCLSLSTDPIVQMEVTCPDGLLVDQVIGTTKNIYGGGFVTGGGIIGGTLLISGPTTMGQLGNGVPGLPIVVNQYGGGALALQVLGGEQISGSLALGASSTNFGTAGQCVVSNGGTAPPVWGSCGTGGGGGATLPASGVVFATSTTTSTVATSPQLVSALNVSPSSTLSPTLIPTLNQSTNGSAGSLSAASVLPSGTTATTQTVGDNTTAVATDAFVLANAGAGSAPIFVHTLTGATPTAVLHSATVAALDTEYVTLGTNVTAINLPAAAAIADAEVLTFNISQPASGGPYTVTAGAAGTPFTAGSGTTVVNAVPGGCPNIGTTVGSTPSQLLITAIYKAGLTQYQVVGCQSLPAQTGVSEGTLSVSGGTFGNYNSNTVLVQTVATNAGHFTSLNMNNASTTSGCTTAPIINVYDGTSNVGVGASPAVVFQARGIATTQAETLAFAAGDVIGIFVQTTGTSCAAPFFTISAQYVEP